MKKAEHPIVGIDLGTTNSSVAYIADGKPVIIPSPKGERIIPSVVMLDMEGQVFVGDIARSSQIAMPDRVVAAVKRKMGSYETVTMGDQEFSPIEISAMIIKELKSYVDRAFDPGQKEAVITVPAYFTDEQRRATKQAGELAGFVVERIINEPTAAALAFGFDRLEEEKHILVYDLGGGTFDVSIVEMMNSILEIKASAGNNMLGGEDFDWLLVDWLSEKFRKRHGLDPRKDIRAKSLLKEQAEKIKIELSSAEKAAVHLPLITMKDNKPAGLSLEITRKEFVALIDHHLLSTIECVGQALCDARLEAADIQDILLVGGSTRIPRVRELLKDMFGKEPHSEVNPDEAVALGAAVQAGLKSGALADSGLIVTDIAPFSLGVAVAGMRNGIERTGIFHAIIPRNTVIPVTRTDRFYTSVPGQTTVQIEIYQGEHEWVKNNYRLGEFLLEGIPVNWSQQEPLDITYSYNLNGILEVTAKCVKNKKEMGLTVQDALERQSQEALSRSMDKLEELYRNAPPDGDDEDDWDDDVFGADDQESDLTPEELCSELEEIDSQLRGLEETSTSFIQKKIRRIRKKIAQTLLLDDRDKLQECLDEATDFLIDIQTMGDD